MFSSVFGKSRIEIKSAIFDNISAVNSAVIKQKDEFQNGCYEKAKSTKFSVKYFLLPDMDTCVCVLGGKKCFLFFRKFYVFQQQVCLSMYAFQSTNCLNVFDYFVGLALKGLTQM